MDKCTYGIDEPTNVEPCVTVGYGIIGDKRNERNNEYERYHDLMRIVANRNDLEYGKDVKLLTIGKSNDLKNYLISHMNQTLYVVLFCGEPSWDEEFEIETINRDQIYNFSMSDEERKTYINL